MNLKIRLCLLSRVVHNCLFSKIENYIGNVQKKIMSFLTYLILKLILYKLE